MPTFGLGFAAPTQLLVATIGSISVGAALRYFAFLFYAVWATVVATLVFYYELLRIGLRRPQSLTAQIAARLVCGL